MAFKLAISNTIVTTIKGVATDGDGNDKPFQFQLVQDRVSQDELEQAMVSKEENATQFLKRVTHDWRGQKLVMLEDSEHTAPQPAPFSDEAFDALLSIAGMPGRCWIAYRDQVLARAKN